MPSYSSIDFSKAIFLKSCFEEKEFPKMCHSSQVPYPEITLIGRSNVGKSSLINHLTQKKDLVRVSSKPGKTQMINFFLIDEKIFLVDLPGYGFADIPKNLQKTWAEKLPLYLKNRKQLSLILFLLDLRRDLSLEDKEMIRWGAFHQKKMLFIFSKTDKLPPSRKKATEENLLQQIKETLPSQEILHLCYSTQDASCRLLLRNFIIDTLSTL